MGWLHNTPTLDQFEFVEIFAGKGEVTRVMFRSQFSPMSPEVYVHTGHVVVFLNPFFQIGHPYKVREWLPLCQLRS